jgi:hypothetical protein
MTDFDDFLRHKYAYVAIGEFKPGCFSEARQLYEKAVSTYTKVFRERTCCRNQAAIAASPSFSGTA